jgi:hypothetical protein
VVVVWLMPRYRPVLVDAEGMTLTGDLPNPYKAAVGRAVSAVRTPAGAVGAALDGAKKAFAAKAWTGGTSGAFGADLAGHAAGAKRAADACVHELQAIHDKEPDKVQLGDWQLHWRNL